MQQRSILHNEVVEAIVPCPSSFECCVSFVRRTLSKRKVSRDRGVNSGPKNVSGSMLEEGELDSMELIEESSELSVFSCKGDKAQLRVFLVLSVTFRQLGPKLIT